MGEPRTPPTKRRVGGNSSTEAERHLIKGFYVRLCDGHTENEFSLLGNGLEKPNTGVWFIAEHVETGAFGYLVQGPFIVVGKVDLVMWEKAVISKANMNGVCIVSGGRVEACQSFNALSYGRTKC